MSDRKYSFIVQAEDEDIRLDKFLAMVVGGESRSYLKKLIKKGNVSVNGIKLKPSSSLRAGDLIDLFLPDQKITEIVPENIPLNIIYEDDSIIILNKQPGIKVHPSINNLTNTLVNGLLFKYGKDNLTDTGDILRPGIVHRLDMDTTGCLIIAKDKQAYDIITKQFYDRNIFKQYLAIVKGKVKSDNGRLEFRIGRNPVRRKRMTVRVEHGKYSLTDYKVLQRFDNASYLQLQIGTGRTHQIRVHMHYIGHPVLGDKEYGKKKAKLAGYNITRHMLHAHRIGFLHPKTGKKVEFSAPIPDDMKQLLAELGT